MSQRVLAAHQPVATRGTKAKANETTSFGFDMRTSLTSKAALRCPQAEIDHSENG